MNRIKAKPLSIKSMVFLLFLAVMVFTIGGIGSLVYVRWAASAEQTTDDIANTIGLSLQQQLRTFMQVPLQINHTSQGMIEERIVHLDDEQERDRFFVSLMSSFDPSLYSFSYGSSDGHYYGARRNTQGAIEIMRNNEQTDSHSWYYSVAEDLSAGEKVLDAGPFDPRTRAWYQVAEQQEGPSFSPVYKHFIIDDLAISAAWPIYDRDHVLQGVLGTHILLNRIGDFLANTVRSHEGQAIVVERESGLLVANSLGLKNFTVSEDGKLKRKHVAELETQAFAQAYEAGQSSLYEDYQVSLFPLQLAGIDWVVISAIPRSLLFAQVRQTIVITIVLALAALLIGLILYVAASSYLMQPISHLLEVSKALSEGDLSKRVSFTRKDEIGGIASSINNVADTMQQLINNLEDQVKERTDALEENKQQLELLLNSTAEGIYGIDLDGYCTFCNQSAVNILGFTGFQQLLGKQMHDLIHHSNRNGKPMAVSSCKIFQSIREGKGYEAEDEVFWRADGTFFEVAYHSYPQIRAGNIVGGVVSFMDITQRKQRENQISYLGSHDPLTGLFNRRHFEEQFRLLDTAQYWPLSLIFADLNGLKLTNDIFGHGAGDRLLCQAAEILKQACRGGDVVARIGGDEFIVLLPNTDTVQARMTISLIHASLEHAPSDAIKCSISLGYETKTTQTMTLAELMANAENAMYKDKVTNRKHVQTDMITTLQARLHARSSREREHAIEVSNLSEILGLELHISKSELATLKQAAFLHDIGKVSLPEKLLHKKTLTEQEYATMQQHAVIGYRILNLFEDTLILAEPVYSHHERWDGTGYPRALKGVQIPLLARIIAIAEVYDRVRNNEEQGNEQRARAVIEQGAGSQFDPDLAALFLKLLQKTDTGRQGS